MSGKPLILFPSDFSPVASHAFKFALQLADSLGARIVFLHVFHNVMLEPDMTPASLHRAIMQEEDEKALEILREYTRGLAKEVGSRAPIEVWLKHGYAVEEISALATEIEPDLVVMGTTGASNTIENWLGSTTTAIMERVNCPVMAIPQAAAFRPIAHIIYAADLKEGGDRFLYQLSSTAHKMGASLERIHVLTHALDEAGKAALEDQYGSLLAFGDMPLKVIEGKNVMAGLTEYAREHEVDLIALSPQKHSLWYQLWHSSHTRKLLLHSPVPVLAVKS